MAARKRARRSIAGATVTFFRNLTAGEMGPLERARMIAGNLARRGGTRRHDCCGNYGDPGC
jgi:hypothetical protein